MTISRDLTQIWVIFIWISNIFIDFNIFQQVSFSLNFYLILLKVEYGWQLVELLRLSYHFLEFPKLEGTLLSDFSRNLYIFKNCRLRFRILNFWQYFLVKNHSGEGSLVYNTHPGHSDSAFGHFLLSSDDVKSYAIILEPPNPCQHTLVCGVLCCQCWSLCLPLKS